MNEYFLNYLNQLPVRDGEPFGLVLGKICSQERRSRLGGDFPPELGVLLQLMLKGLHVVTLQSNRPGAGDLVESALLRPLLLAVDTLDEDDAVLRRLL